MFLFFVFLLSNNFKKELAQLSELLGDLCLKRKIIMGGKVSKVKLFEISMVLFSVNAEIYICIVL